MNIYNTTVSSKKMLNSHMIELDIKKPQDFVFTSGQFIQILIPQADKQTPRAYSICSTETDPDLHFCIKILEDGIGSNFIKNIKVGDGIQIKGPQGRFTCNDAEHPLLFVATGAGMAPIISQIRHQLEINKSTRSIYLVFGVRHEDDLFWHEELQQLKDNYQNLHIDITLSQPTEQWQGLTGRVTAYIPDVTTDTQVFLCGSPAMVQEVRKILIEKELDAKHIHFEIF